MASDQVVTAKDVLDALLRVQRRGGTRNWSSASRICAST